MDLHSAWEPLPRRSCPAPPRDPGSEQNRPHLGAQGRGGQCTSPPSRLRRAPRSGGSFRPAPARSPAPQAQTPARQALSHWTGQSRKRSRGTPQARSPAAPHSPPASAAAHNIRPASRLRRPSGVKLSARRARASASGWPPPEGPFCHLQPGYPRRLLCSIADERPAASDPCPCRRSS